MKKIEDAEKCDGSKILACAGTIPTQFEKDGVNPKLVAISPQI